MSDSEEEYVPSEPEEDAGYDDSQGAYSDEQDDVEFGRGASDEVGASVKWTVLTSALSKKVNHAHVSVGPLANRALGTSQDDLFGEGDDPLAMVEHMGNQQETEDGGMQPYEYLLAQQQAHRPAEPSTPVRGQVLPQRRVISLQKTSSMVDPSLMHKCRLPGLQRKAKGRGLSPKTRKRRTR